MPPRIRTTNLFIAQPIEAMIHNCTPWPKKGCALAGKSRKGEIRLMHRGGNRTVSGSSKCFIFRWNPLTQIKENFFLTNLLIIPAMMAPAKRANAMRRRDFSKGMFQNTTIKNYKIFVIKGKLKKD
jgi:hypothetical protein